MTLPDCSGTGEAGRDTKIEQITLGKKWKRYSTTIKIENYEIPDSLIEAAIEYIPEEPFSYDTWEVWIRSITSKTGLKGKELFMPLRLILTGKDKGPELKNFLPLLDKEALLRKFGKI